jgi:hypothetical protein
VGTEELLSDFRELPFPHLVFASFLSKDVENHLLDVLESASWERRSASFYRFDVPGNAGVRKDLLRVIEDDVQLYEKRSLFEESFNCRLATESLLEVHRYNNGDGIGAHTDFRTPELRCILSLNRGWRMEDGGIWVIAADSSLRDNKTYLPSISNTGFAFCTGPTSYHALSRHSTASMFGVTIRIPRQ